MTEIELLTEIAEHLETIANFAAFLPAMFMASAIAMVVAVSGSIK